MNYVIVKHAAPEVQVLYWDENPQNGVSLAYSAVDTYTGIQCNIQSRYVALDKAQQDCDRMNAANPSGYYAVCPVAV